MLPFGRLYPQISVDSNRSKFILISEISEARKVALWLRALAALKESTHPVYSIYNVDYNHP